MGSQLFGSKGVPAVFGWQVLKEVLICVGQRIVDDDDETAKLAEAHTQLEEKYKKACEENLQLEERYKKACEENLQLQGVVAKFPNAESKQPGTATCEVSKQDHKEQQPQVRESCIKVDNSSSCPNIKMEETSASSSTVEDFASDVLNEFELFDIPDIPEVERLLSVAEGQGIEAAA